MKNIDVKAEVKNGAVKAEVKNEVVAPVDGVKAEVKNEAGAPVGETDKAAAAEKLAKFKAMKKEAAERFKERRAKEREERVAVCKRLIDQLKSIGAYDKLSDDAKAFLSNTINPPKTVNTGNTVFSKMFGSSPAVGTAVTLKDAFQRTLLGKPNIDAYIKRWAEKGIVIEYKQDVADIFSSTYTITKM